MSKLKIFVPDSNLSKIQLIDKHILNFHDNDDHHDKILLQN
jgi:hypothetical protein